MMTLEIGNWPAHRPLRPGKLEIGNGRCGLTLIEVILAVAILSVGLTVLLTAASRCLAVMKTAKNYQIAQWTLNRGEVDYPLVNTNDVKKLEVDPVSYPGGFTFSRVVEDDEDEDGLFVVRTRVSWSKGDRGSYEETVRYILQVED